jgi:hypothetical protein
MSRHTCGAGAGSRSRDPRAGSQPKCGLYRPETPGEMLPNVIALRVVRPSERLAGRIKEICHAANPRPRAPRSRSRRRDALATKQTIRIRRSSFTAGARPSGSTDQAKPLRLLAGLRSKLLPRLRTSRFDPSGFFGGQALFLAAALPLCLPASSASTVEHPVDGLCFLFVEREFATPVCATAVAQADAENRHLRRSDAIHNARIIDTVHATRDDCDFLAGFEVVRAVVAAHSTSRGRVKPSARQAAQRAQEPSSTNLASFNPSPLLRASRNAQAMSCSIRPPRCCSCKNRRAFVGVLNEYLGAEAIHDAPSRSARASAIFCSRN